MLTTNFEQPLVYNLLFTACTYNTQLQFIVQQFEIIGYEAVFGF